MMRRLCPRLQRFCHKHNISGGVTLIMTAFIISYIVIVRLDADKPHLRQNATTAQPHTKSVLRPKERNKDVTKDPSNEFPRKGAKTYAIKAHDDNLKNNVDDTTEVLIMSENEQFLNSELENHEEDIDRGWGNYLNRNQNNVNSGGDPRQQNRQNHLSFQAVHLNDLSSQLKQLSNIKSVLPKNAVVYDVFKENKVTRDATAKNKCVLLKTIHGDSPICIHDPDFDEIISASIMETGTWEPNYLYMVGRVLQLNADIVFLDLGCNIGVYTILAAKLGHAVVAVDPNKKNLRLLTKSLSLGHLNDKVTLLWNAISDVHENVTVNEIIGNVGGAYVDTANKGEEALDLARTLTLDDLSALLTNRPVFIKMDIETYELKALKGASNFFSVVEVQYVLMEWIAHREADTGSEIIKFMEHHGLYPHINAHHNTKLEISNYKSWPDNILWISY